MSALFNKEDILTILTADKAKIGDEGYFGNSWLDLQEAIKNNYLAGIATIFTGRCDCFMNNVENTIYGLFLPADKVKEVEEKKWRAFKDFNEFKFWTDKGVGSVIVYRDKLTNDELEAVITRSKLYENFVEIGAVEYTFKELFDQWEWLSNRNDWQPFGVRDYNEN